MSLHNQLRDQGDPCGQESRILHYILSLKIYIIKTYTLVQSSLRHQTQRSLHKGQTSLKNGTRPFCKFSSRCPRPVGHPWERSGPTCMATLRYQYYRPRIGRRQGTRLPFCTFSEVVLSGRVIPLWESTGHSRTCSLEGSECVDWCPVGDFSLAETPETIGGLRPPNTISLAQSTDQSGSETS